MTAVTRLRRAPKPGDKVPRLGQAISHRGRKGFVVGFHAHLVALLFADGSYVWIQP